MSFSPRRNISNLLLNVVVVFRPPQKKCGASYVKSKKSPAGKCQNPSVLRALPDPLRVQDGVMTSPFYCCKLLQVHQLVKRNSTPPIFFLNSQAFAPFFFFETSVVAS
jgi:hypothetical protein